MPRPSLDEPAPALIEAAFAALAEGKFVRARRLGQEVARLPVPRDAAAGRDASASRLDELGRALEQQGARRQSLLLARTLIEREGGTAVTAVSREERARQVGELLERCVRLQEPDLAARWAADLGAGLRRREPAGERPDDESLGLPRRYRATQRAAFHSLAAPRASDGRRAAGSSGDTAGRAEQAIARLLPLLGGHGGAAGALALGGRLAAELPPERSAAIRAEMLRAALAAERLPRRRRMLALRLAETLRDGGDVDGALAALGRVIDELPAEHAAPLRQARANLLRVPGREAELARALDSDADATRGAAHTALRVEQAALLDRLGEQAGALEVRLQALAETPGHLPLLGPARERLEVLGRLERSLELATAAIPTVADRQARAGLLRDIATLAEVAASDPSRAAEAWLEVLSLHPEDGAAADAAERLLRQLGDRKRLGEHLAWGAARATDAEARAGVLWRLAEFRRVEEQSPATALPLYREIIETRGRAAAEALGVTDDDWQRRDDTLALHTARALAAPAADARARAIAERASALIDAGRLEEADRDLGRALDLDPTVAEVMQILERLYEKRNDWRGLRQRLAARVDGATGTTAAQLWFGIGRANERMGDAPAARSAYERALAADERFRQAVTLLRQIATARGDAAESARLLEREIELTTVPAERVGLLTELGGVLGDKLGRAPRAIEVLDSALGIEPTNQRALEAMFAVALASGSWERAAQALETLLGSGASVPDASARYHQLGQAAEKAGQFDRALGLYSRSYARNPAYRPTLERLSDLCFERQQWDNAWKATEHLLERHGADLDAGTRADLQLRSALADLHVAQRLVAANRIAGWMVGPTPQTGLRDVADSWASMRFDPRLLRGLEGDRRARVLARLAEVQALTETNPRHAARAGARETLAALAMVDRRWADALSLLDGLGGDAAVEPERRCLFLIAAGDLLAHQQGDAAGAALRYQRARALNPKEPRLRRPGIA